MTKHRSEIATLSRALATQEFSLGNYVAEAEPWTRPGDDKLMQELMSIAQDRNFYAKRLTAAINANEGVVVSGAFPMSFTSLNDLAIDYLLPQLVMDHRKTIVELERCVEILVDDAPSWQLVSEVLGSERAHLETLEQFRGTRRTNPACDGSE